ncbi:hypothetical protein [Streptantibioticus ferralitis]|nr:hypothetical protein [Streptantibioticus ferralitis]
MGAKAETDTEPDKKRIELSLTQVAGSGAAALLAAYLASFLGVYGTILGAAVVSVLATTGGAILQHIFRRTGEQLRDVTVPLARPQARPQGTEADATKALPAFGATRAADPPTTVVPRAEPDTALLMPRLPRDESYNESTLHGTRWRGWRRSLLAAGAVFALSMAVFTGIELAGGSPLSHTAIGQAVNPGGARTAPSKPAHDQPGAVPSGSASESGTDGGSTPSQGPGTSDGGSTPSAGSSDTPSQGGGSASPNTTPSQAPSPGPSNGTGTGSGDSGSQGRGGSSARPGAVQQAPSAGTGAQ